MILCIYEYEVHNKLRVKLYTYNLRLLASFGKTLCNAVWAPSMVISSGALPFLFIPNWFSWSLIDDWYWWIVLW